ncbi:MAG: thioredoxin-like domain-containing protein [Bacteroidales bacterium]|nr:thioredoxin-like domain-containing protein [Bacteroidales bacterium]
MKNTVALLFALCIGSGLLAAEKGYKITLKLTGSADTSVLLAHYYGSKQYLDDTAYRNKQGFYIFEGAEKLKDGMYIIAGTNKNKYFDFFLTGTQQIDFTCNPANVVNTMQVKGSDDNKAFYAYIKYLGSKQTEIEPLNNWMKANRNRKDSVAIVKSRIEAIDKEAKEFIRNFYTSNPGFLSANFVKANNEPEYMQYITSPDGKVDSTLMYPTYKAHYFDNFTFTDPRLIYTPVFAQKVDFYLDKLVVPTRDSLEKDIDRVMTLSSVNKEMATYMAWFLSLKYETSQVMGHDALFVYIVRKYLETGKVDYQYPEVKDNILKRINALEPLLLDKVAPELILVDTNNVAHSLQATKARYTLLFFWESTCGHCQQEMPKVLKFYEDFRTKYNLEIYSISTDTSFVKWKAYIKKNNMSWINVNGHLSVSGNYHTLYDIRSTPIMYLLDENKKILTKFLLIDDISNVILTREKALEKSKKEKTP